MPKFKTTTSYISEVKLFTDGGCRGNPGPSAIGVMILDTNNEQLHAHAECIGASTNNRAEYKALIKGLDLCAKYTRGRVTCYCDSQLAINQINGVWRLKDDTLRDLFHEVKKREQVFKEVIFQHVKRTNQFIRKADRLLNEAFDGQNKKS